MGEEIAKGLAKKLIWIYNEHMIPRYAELNRSHPEGFTQERMQGNPDSLFQMIVLAAYDRQPFTRVAKGWEAIWGLAGARPSLPAILRGAGVFDLNSVLSLPAEEIERCLVACLFFGYRLHSDGAYTRYGKTLKDAADVVGSGLLSLVESARTASDVITIHTLLDSIHGIGPTIASKVVKYTLREIRLSNIDTRELYPAVKPILAEYHNARLAQELRNRYGQPNLMEHVFEALKELGDPFALDALYYVDRDQPELRKCLIPDVATPPSVQHLKRREDIREKREPQTKPARSIPDRVLQVARAKFGSQPFSRGMLQQTTEAVYGKINPDSFLTADWTVNQKSGYELDQKSGRWYKRHPILFKREDGLLELYDPFRHGSWTLINGKPERIG